MTWNLFDCLHCVLFHSSLSRNLMKSVFVVFLSQVHVGGLQRSRLQAAQLTGACLPQQGRDHMIEAIRLDPSEPWGPAMLGAWHLEVVRRAGEGMFDANEAEGLSLMRQAVEMGDAPAAIPYRFAVALVAADPAVHGEEATLMLNRAIETAESDAVGQAVLGLATSLLGLLQTDPAAAQTEAVRLLEE